MDFNERTVVDFPKSGFRYQRRPTKVAKKLKDADIDRVSLPLRDLSGADHEFINHINTILNFLRDTFFILTVNAKLLAISIHHLRLTGFFLVDEGVLHIDRDFIPKKENYSPTGGVMKDTLSLFVNKKKYNDTNSENYRKYIVKTIAEILRYQRFMIRHFGLFYEG